MTTHALPSSSRLRVAQRHAVFATIVSGRVTKKNSSAPDNAASRPAQKDTASDAPAKSGAK